MTRIYEHEGYTLEVSVEADLAIGAKRLAQRRPGYIAVVRIFQASSPLSPLSPLRFGETAGRPFSTEADALMGGYSAGRNLIDDVFCHEVR
ncbi:hypothetical protein [Paraburkholderia bannensis]|uniref:hypothetical protein n=1 Tax=Paraburkholderia bannensis TaxID=765414 RepID=UPI002AB6BB23|nr:hypothetical protein [Paraburkholderia bannensis]